MGKTMAIFMVMAMIATGIVLFPAGVEAETPEQAYTIKGKVLNNETDKAVLGVTVFISVHDNGIIKSNQTVTTDPNGAFSKIFWLDNAYNFTIIFSKIGYNNRTRHFMNDSFKDRISDTNITLLQPQDLLKGKVVVKDTTTAIKDVKVYVNDIEDKNTWAILTTDSNGEFTHYTNNDTVNLHFYKSGYYAGLLENQKVLNNITVEMEKILTETPIKVWGRVFGKDDVRLSGAIVSVSPGDERWITTISDEVGYYEILAYPGNFQIQATMRGYKNSVPEWINVPSDKAVKKDVTLTETPSETLSIAGTIYTLGTPTNNTRENAIIYLHSTDGQYVNRTTSKPDGSYNMSFYPPETIDDSFVLEVRFENYFTATIQNIRTNLINQDITLMPIDNKWTLSGFVYTSDTILPLKDATITIYDQQHIYHQTATTTANGFFSFNVHEDSDFWVLVEADGYQSVVENVLDITSDRSIDIELIPSGKDIEEITYEFIDWNTIHVTKNSVITVDNVSLRMNMDRKFGMDPVGLGINNGILDAGEVQEWADYLRDKGLEQRDTKKFLTLNNTFFQLNTTSYTVMIDGADGAVNADATIYINSTYDYTLVPNEEVLNLDSNIFELVFNTTYDTAYLDYVNHIILPLDPAKYEMTENMTMTNKVVVSGYNNPITIDPKVHIANETESVT
ncbi:MAG: carboxypeptidase regulatory-like domain-containing protein, partial [Thermoplasmata archaeon]